jgi:hypothetical protein
VPPPRSSCRACSFFLFPQIRPCAPTHSRLHFLELARRAVEHLPAPLFVCLAPLASTCSCRVLSVPR